MAAKYPIKKYPYYMHIRGGDTPHWAKVLRRNRCLRNREEKLLRAKMEILIKPPSLWSRLYQFMKQRELKKVT